MLPAQGLVAQPVSAQRSSAGVGGGRSVPCWVTVAGIRSTGLTAALGIADYVYGLAARAPWGRRFAIAKQISLNPADCARLCDQMLRDQPLGAVNIGGQLYRISHPITKASIPRLASMSKL